MAIFNSYVSLPEGIPMYFIYQNLQGIIGDPWIQHISPTPNANKRGDPWGSHAVSSIQTNVDQTLNIKSLIILDVKYWLHSKYVNAESC